MSNAAGPALLDALLDSWDRNHRILVHLLRLVPPDALALPMREEGRTIGQLFTHMHYVRLAFVEEDAPECRRELPGEEWRNERDPERIAAWLDESAQAVRDAVAGRLADGRAMDQHYDHPILMLQHLIWHEGYHHGQIKLVLKQQGRPITDQEAGPGTWGVWMRKTKQLAVALLVALGCSHAAPAEATPSRWNARPAVIGIDSTATLEVAIEQVSFGDSVPGTLVRPVKPGRFPAIVLMAGSGPTDRDWNSPMLPGRNGSAKLLAESLATRGAVVLRFDKAGIGGNRTLLDGRTIDVYRDEGRAALAYLRTRPDVSAAHLFVAGHSEGGMHALRVAQTEERRIAGLMLLSAGGRPLRDVLLGQLESQLATAMPATADSEMTAIRTALDEFLAGRTVDPTRVTKLLPLQQIMFSLFYEKTAALSRGLLAFDPAAAIVEVDVPVLVYSGLKDIQIDPTLDAARLEQVRRGAAKEVTLWLAPEANHVLKHEPKSLAELRADLMAVQTAYNADGRSLDPASVAALVRWLARHTSPR